MQRVVWLTISLLLCACGGAPDSADEQGATGASGLPQHLVVVEKPLGGTVSSGPSRIDCGSVCSARFDAGSEVQLKAIAAPGYLFDSWTGSACSTAQTICALNVVGDLHVGAVFKTLAQAGY
jgi:hypothetical protein